MLNQSYHISETNCMTIALDEYGSRVIEAIHTSMIPPEFTAIYTTSDGWQKYSGSQPPERSTSNHDYSTNWWEDHYQQGKELLLNQLGFLQQIGFKKIKRDGSLNIFVVTHLDEEFGRTHFPKVQSLMQDALGSFKQFEITLILGLNTETITVTNTDGNKAIKEALLSLENTLKSQNLSKNGRVNWCYLQDLRDIDGYTIPIKQEGIDLNLISSYPYLVQTHVSAEFLVALTAGLVQQKDYQESGWKSALLHHRNIYSEAVFSTFNAESMQFLIPGLEAEDQNNTVIKTWKAMFHVSPEIAQQHAEDLFQRFRNEANYLSYNFGELLKKTLPVFNQIIRPPLNDEVQPEEVTNVIRNWDSFLWNKWSQEEKLKEMEKDISQQFIHLFNETLNLLIEEVTQSNIGGIEIIDIFVNRLHNDLIQQKTFPTPRPKPKLFWFKALLNRLLGIYLNGQTSEQSALDFWLEKYEKHLTERVNRPALFSRNTMLSTGIFVAVLFSLLGIVPLAFTGLLILLFTSWGVGLLGSILRLYLEDMRLYRTYNQAVETIQNKYRQLYTEELEKTKKYLYDQLLGDVDKCKEVITQYQSLLQEADSSLVPEKNTHFPTLLTTRLISPFGNTNNTIEESLPSSAEELASDFLKEHQIQKEIIPEPLIQKLKHFIHDQYIQARMKIPFPKLVINASVPTAGYNNMHNALNKFILQMENTCLPALPINEEERSNHIFLGFNDNLPWEEQIFVMLPDDENVINFRFETTDRNRFYFRAPVDNRLSYIVLLHNLKLREMEIFKPLWDTETNNNTGKECNE